MCVVLIARCGFTERVGFCFCLFVVCLFVVGLFFGLFFSGIALDSVSVM